MSRSNELIKVGSLVFMTRVGREEYEDDPLNPHDQVGVLISNSEEDWGDGQIYEVKWLEGTNTYQPEWIQAVGNLEDFIQPMYLGIGKVDPSLLRTIEEYHA